MITGTKKHAFRKAKSAPVARNSPLDFALARLQRAIEADVGRLRQQEGSQLGLQLRGPYSKGAATVQ